MRMRIVSPLDSTVCDSSDYLFSIEQNAVNQPSTNLLPTDFGIESTYPNPFNREVTISIAIPTRNNVTVRLYNLMGKDVATLWDGVLEPGYRQLRWQAGSHASGTYFLVMEAKGQQYRQKLLYLR